MNLKKLLATENTELTEKKTVETKSWITYFKCYGNARTLCGLCGLNYGFEFLGVLRAPYQSNY